MTATGKARGGELRGCGFQARQVAAMDRSYKSGFGTTFPVGAGHARDRHTTGWRAGAVCVSCAGLEARPMTTWLPAHFENPTRPT